MSVLLLYMYTTCVYEQHVPLLFDSFDCYFDGRLRRRLLFCRSVIIFLNACFVL